MRGDCLSGVCGMSFGIKRNLTDALFSDVVRELANWVCQRCGGNFEERKDIFDNSHFYSRRNRSVRFDFENTSAICRGCHIYFGEHPAEHTEFFKKKLGEKGFDALSRRAHTPQKVDERALRIGFKLMLKSILEKKKSQILGAR